MATIYAAYGPDGLIGRCDAKYHEAIGTECHCICGGVMHGVGSRIAQEDSEHLTDDDIMENIPDRVFNRPVRISRRAWQLILFEPAK